MCGIAGWFDMQATRQPSRALVGAMTDAISHRGPDGEGFYFAPGLGLGHRRLAVIDLNTGDQPMLSEGGALAIVFNGEIYNYRELQITLRQKGHRFGTQSDTEVILEAWREWGDKCVEHLRGMFAFALWDSQNQSLFLARDRLGEKPLYYSMLSDGTFVFGSELKALLVNSSVERRIDPCAVADFFALGYIADPKTIYQGIKKLEAGFSLKLVRGSSSVLRQYWDAVPRERADSNISLMAEELRERLKTAVRSQLIADVPVGTFLSGGVDSSAVSVLAASQVDHPINAFTIGFGDAKFDERGYAERVAHRYGLNQLTEEVSPDEMHGVDELVAMFDEPFGDSSAIPTALLAQLARREVKVALSGDGGDELFAGYRRYGFHKTEELIRNLIPGFCRRRLFSGLARIYPQLDWLPRPLRARQTFKELSCDDSDGYYCNVSVLDDQTRSNLISSTMRKVAGGYHPKDVISFHMAKLGDVDPITAAQYVDIKTWLVGDILTKVDRTAMAFGLEVRVPMLDAEFVEWALGLPSSAKYHRGEGKFILKRAFESVLPDDILYRPKQGFSVPLAAWFRGSLGDKFVQSLIHDEQLGEFLDLGFVRRMLADHRRGWIDNSRALWLVWMFKGFLAKTHTKPARDFQGPTRSCETV